MQKQKFSEETTTSENEPLLFRNGCKSVHTLLTIYGRPMTTQEILYCCSRNTRTVHKQIEAGLRRDTLREFILDFRPHYTRPVRLIALVVEPFQAEFITSV